MTLEVSTAICVILDINKKQTYERKAFVETLLGHKSRKRSGGINERTIQRPIESTHSTTQRTSQRFIQMEEKNGSRESESVIREKMKLQKLGHYQKERGLET